LPYYEEAGLKGLYHLDEPWDGPHNSQLRHKMNQWLFHCPRDVETDSNTSIVAVTGPDGAWPLDKQLSAKDFTDGLSNTIIVVEVHNSGINWLEPRDLTFEEAARGINPRDGNLGISSAHKGGANVLFADGAVHYLRDDIPPDVLRALLTANGGEEVKIPE
jgi:prepilin-type processing-associated H-X9-DG protein